MINVRIIIKKALTLFGMEPRVVYEKIGMWSLRAAVSNGLSDLVEKLRTIVPDISNQESSEIDLFNDYWELKRRALQAFQCSLMLKFLDNVNSAELTVVDIGDSAGTHMLYLKELTKGRFNIDTISVNLDPRAIEKIKARGLKAIHCRAEELDLGEQYVDLFTSFQMVEHLHNPAIFFRRLAKKTKSNNILITVPYLKESRVGLHHIRYGTQKNVFAEEEHIFELNPQDWTLLFLHSGWKVVYSEIHYQYPRKWPIISPILKYFWKYSDFEGFWGAFLEKDTTFSDCYQDWED
ncbi:MAG: class I SAM-dependent methyltransferase [Desulfobacterales bacterium]|nr:class I SAM-dependent methyltransferase [Desulfobacterales bacterium]